MATRLAALLVEDNPDDADVLSETLREVHAPVQLTTVETLRDAFTQLEQARFDVVLLDLSLPDSQGLATVERALAHTGGVPILVLTGLEDESLGAAAVHAGAQDYLIKGRGDGLLLVRCMRYAMERHRLLTAQIEIAARNAQLVDELERSNSIKTYFAATMSHELRGTLFAIGGLGEMLAGEIADIQNGEAARLARAITERSHESLGMIQAALELTRSEVRRSDCDAVEVDVNRLMQRLAAETHVPHEKAGLRVQWNIAASLPSLRTDAIKVEMVLKNLISNAIKFTEQGGVRISVAPHAGGLRFVVADSGIGIADADLPHLFEPFTQAHGQRSRRAGGVGLGLYIAGRLVDLLGGHIDVESRPAVGTTFTVTIPASSGPPHSATGSSPAVAL